MLGFGEHQADGRVDGHPSLRSQPGEEGLKRLLGIFKAFSLKIDPTGAVALGVEVTPSAALPTQAGSPTTLQRTAWHINHRIREAMRLSPLADMLHGTIVADETYHGGNPKNRHGNTNAVGGRGTDKTPVFSLIHAETGEVRSRAILNVTGDTLGAAIREHVDTAGSTLWTDKWAGYLHVGREFKRHIAVDHDRGEYVRDGGDTNHTEGYFSQLKRSLDGTHHHISKTHLPRYLAEHDFRYSTCKISDSERMERLMGQTSGRRLPYRVLTQNQG